MSSAVVACTLGIFAGDVGLWAIGRTCGRTVLAWPRVPDAFSRIDFTNFGRGWTAMQAGRSLQVVSCLARDCPFM